MRSLVLIGLLFAAGTSLAQDRRERIVEQYAGYRMEVKAWLDRADYSRAEKVARYAIKFAIDNDLNENPGEVLLAEALFRQNIFEEAARLFASSIKPGKNGKADGMYIVVAVKGPQGECGLTHSAWVVQR